MSTVLAGLAFAGNDNASQIKAFCVSKVGAEAAAQTACRQRQHAAAAQLVDEIQMAAEGTREYKAAKNCIERAKVAQPAQIDWPKALRCFKNQIEGGTEAPVAAEAN